MKSLKIKTNKIITKRKRSLIEKEFIDNETVIFRMPLSEAIIKNQKLILETLLDIRDEFCKLK